MSSNLIRLAHDCPLRGKQLRLATEADTKANRPVWRFEVYGEGGEVVDSYRVVAE